MRTAAPVCACCYSPLRRRGLEGDWWWEVVERRPRVGSLTAGKSLCSPKPLGWRAGGSVLFPAGRGAPAARRKRRDSRSEISPGRRAGDGGVSTKGVRSTSSPQVAQKARGGTPFSRRTPFVRRSGTAWARPRPAAQQQDALRGSGGVVEDARVERRARFRVLVSGGKKGHPVIIGDRESR